LAAVGAAAELARLGWQTAAGWPAAALLRSTGFGAGVAALTAEALWAARAAGRRGGGGGGERERSRRWARLRGCVVLVGLVLVTGPWAALTAPLHPRVVDGAARGFDAALALPIGDTAVRALAAAPWLGELSALATALLPFAMLIVWGQRRRTRAAAELATALVAAAVIAFAAWHVLPVVGPRIVGAGAGLEPQLAMPAPRDRLPSLATAWLVLLWWHAHGRPGLRAALGVGGVLMIVGALGSGRDYVADLVLALPVAALALAGSAVPSPARRRALAAGAALFAGWLALLGGGALGGSALAPPWAALIAWATVLATVATTWAIERTLRRAAAGHVAADDDAAVGASVTARAPAAEVRLNRAVAAAFFLSGFAGLLYEVVFEKALALTFGSTARAATTVLATYMGGIALGAFLGGRLGARRSDPLRLYALCEGGIALLAALSPLTFRGVRAAYVVLAGGGDPARPSLTWLQLALGAAVLLPPTLLMGITMPVVTRHFSDRRQTLGVSVGTLYGANTLGAALGATLAGYALLPSLGVSGTTWLAVAANLTVAVVGLRLHERARDLPPAAAPAAGSDTAALPARGDAAVPLVVLTVGGVVTLALEVVYVHLLAVVAGNSAYAFALMLGCFLLALGCGAALMRRALAGGIVDAASALAWGQLGVAGCLLGGVFLWNAVPDYFAGFERYPLARSFGAREVVRFGVCALAMAPPAACIGAAYPAAMEWIGRSSARPVAAFGRASALNTAGNIVGALVGALLVARLGSLRSLQLLATISALLGIIAVVGVARRRRLAALAPLVAVAALALAQPRAFDLSRLASGANVYFAYQSYGTVIDHAESLDGGLTTVAESRDPDGSRVLTLLTNGKFQGDDSPRREVAAQWGFALYPLLHTAGRDRALVIGFGTGTTTAATRDAGFATVDVVDLSRDILQLADRYFGRVNGGVLHAPGVSAHVTDGRNWLLLCRQRYDLITIEVTSIWFAGAAALYNRELYELAAGALGERGVLQQWMQLHRLSPADLASILASVRAVFPHVTLYTSGTQGAIVACRHECAPNAETLARLDATPALQPALALFGGHAGALLRQQLLDDAAIARLLAASAGDSAELVSTDDNLFLEYDTPRGNVRPFARSLAENQRWLRSFARPRP
jgi:spermidine synthase